jgi:signal transduction histidine kinase
LNFLSTPFTNAKVPYFKWILRKFSVCMIPIVAKKGFCFVDANGVIEYICPESLKCFEVATAKALNQRLHIVLDKVLDNQSLEIFKNLHQIKERRNFVLPNRLSGNDIFVQIHPQETGHSIFFQETNLQVSKDSRQFSKLDEVIERTSKAASEWRFAFDSLVTPIIILDTNENIVRLNATARELIGEDYNQVLRQPIQTNRWGKFWRDVAMLAHLAQVKKSVQKKQIIDAKTGQTWDVSADWFFTPTTSEPRIIIILYNETEKVSLQETLKKNAVMSAMGTLVAGVAHEVRNPLFGISAILDAMEIQFQGDETFREFSQVLRKELDRLTKLMSELLEYGKPPSNELAKESIVPIIRQSIEAVQPLADKNRVKIRCEIEQNLPFIMMERGRLSQVFQNLMENAIHHTAAGGEIIVTAKMGEQTRSRHIECLVRDKGKGFDPKDLPRIFEPFFSKRRGGTGLGLSIVQRIVEEHRGTIYAKNHSQGGAVVQMFFPSAEKY